MSVTLQEILDDSSYLLGESGTPASEVAKRTRFANDAKGAIAKIRHWSWELKSGDPVNYVYSATPTNGVYSYTLNPSAGHLKDRTAIFTLKFTDQNGNNTYFSPVDETTLDNVVINGQTDNVFTILGNEVDGFVLTVNAGSSALPTQNVSSAWNYRYFAIEPSFVSTSDTSPIPSLKVLSEYVAAEVFFGYREQSQYQLARQRYQDSLEDLALKDQKAAPFQSTAVKSFRQAVGFSNNFKTYY